MIKEIDISEKIKKEIYLSEQSFFNQINKIQSKEELDLLEKFELLKDVGFNSSQETRKALDIIIERLAAEFIAELQMKYPFCMVIKESIFREILKKYKLDTMAIQNFRGIVPEKNLLEIKRYKDANLGIKNTWQGKEEPTLWIACDELSNSSDYKSKCGDPIVYVETCVKYGISNCVWDNARINLIVIISKWGPEANDEKLQDKSRYN